MTAAVGSTVGWAGASLCVVVLFAALVVLSVRRPCVNSGPRGNEPVVVLLAALVGQGFVLAPVVAGAPGWVDVVVAAVVVTALLTLVGVASAGWLRNQVAFHLGQRSGRSLWGSISGGVR